MAQEQFGEWHLDRAAVRTEKEAQDNWFLMINVVAGIIAVPVAGIAALIAWMLGNDVGTVATYAGLTTWFGCLAAVALFYVGRFVFEVLRLYVLAMVGLFKGVAWLVRKVKGTPPTDPTVTA